MKKLNKILIVLVAVTIVMEGLSYAQPNIPREEIPSNITPDVRIEILRLYSRDPVERGNAAYNLGNLREKAASAVPFLIGILGDRTALMWVPESRKIPFGGIRTSPARLAVEALGKIKDPRAVQPLIVSLKDEDDFVRKGSEMALMEMKIEDVHAIEQMIFALKDKNYYLQDTVKKVLNEIDPTWGNSKAAKQAVHDFIVASKDEDSSVREGAVMVLGKIKDPRVTESLIPVLKDKDSSVRKRAVKVLGETKDPQTIDPLISTLKDENSSVRMSTAIAFGEIKDPRSVEPLIVCLEDKDDSVRYWAADALVKITKQNFGDNIRKWQEWWEQNKKKLPATGR